MVHQEDKRVPTETRMNVVCPCALVCVHEIQNISDDLVRVSDRVLTTMTICAHLVIHTRISCNLFIESAKDPVHVQRRSQEQQRRVLSLQS